VKLLLGREEVNPDKLDIDDQTPISLAIILRMVIIKWQPCYTPGRR